MANENVHPYFKGILNSISSHITDNTDDDTEPQYRDYVPAYLDGFNKKNKEEEFETALAEWQTRQEKKEFDQPHPESTCQSCGGINPVWSADNELWNKVVGSPYGILCPTCFVKKANEMDINCFGLRPSVFQKDKKEYINDLISKIPVNRANFEYIAENGKINGGLLQDLRDVFYKILK